MELLQKEAFTMKNLKTPKTRIHKIRVALLQGLTLNRKTLDKLGLGEFNSSLHSDIPKLKNHPKTPLPIESVKTHDRTHDYFIPANEIKRYYDPDERRKQIRELSQERLLKQQAKARKTLALMKPFLTEEHID